MVDASALGAKVRSVRRRRGLTQAQLASRLGVSPSYLNLIEHDRRRIPAPLLLRIAEVLELDLRALAPAHDARLAADLLEAFGDSVFDGHELSAAEVREVAQASPAVARAVVALHHAYRGAREAAATLASRIDEGGAGGLDSRLPTEEVSDLIERHRNYFPDLEDGAEALRREAGLEAGAGGDLTDALTAWLRRAHGIEVAVERAPVMGRAVRRFDPVTRRLLLSEVLRRGSRNFQLAYQAGLQSQAAALERAAADPLLTSPEARALCKVALANYFAAAVLMPYRPFLEAAREERYDAELLGHRFRVSFEQSCHRLTTLRRPGAEGVPFHMVRIDIAGNISKHFSPSGLRFPRFGGMCSRWALFGCFLTPGMIRTQLSELPDGRRIFWVARTVRRDSGGFHAPRTFHALALGCDVAEARQLVYADGVDLESGEAMVPVGITCRLCERMDCEQRAFPPLQHRLQVEENVRGVSFYAPITD
jgi:predicted transcriptional regulator/transcriptional regulator with XRE-family HTH domain